MTMTEQTGLRVKGTIHGYTYRVDTGAIIKRIEKQNITSYAAADIMARLIGNDVLYVPRYMGFIYGSVANPATPLVRPITNRAQVWEDIGHDELAQSGVNGNVIISPLASGPIYSVNGSAVNYTGNSVTLTAHTSLGTGEYGFPLGDGTGSSYAAAFVNNDYIYQVLLITRLVSPTGVITYLPFARADLGGGSDTYPQKLDGEELAIFWDIVFF